MKAIDQQFAQVKLDMSLLKHMVANKIAQKIVEDNSAEIPMMDYGNRKEKGDAVQVSVVGRAIAVNEIEGEKVLNNLKDYVCGFKDSKVTESRIFS